MKPLILLFLFFFSPISSFAQTPEVIGVLPSGEAVPALVEAVKQREEGESAAAIAALRQIIEAQKSPLCDYAQFEIAQIHYTEGKYKEALPEYEKLIANYPESILFSQARLMAGKSSFNQKNYPKAIKAFNQLIRDCPAAKEAAEAQFLIAKAYQKSGKWKEAYLAYEKTDLEYPLSYFAKSSRIAIKGLKKAHRKQLPRFQASAKALYKKGMAYFENDEYEAAANIFNRLAREYPKSKYVGEAWLMLGRAEIQTNNYISGLTDLERATQGSSNLAGRAHYYLGRAYGRRGEYPFAIAALKKVAERYPDSGLADDAAYWVAYYQELNGDINQALISYYNLINNYPYSKSVPAAVWRIGKTYYWRGDFKNASTYLHLAQLYPASEDTPRCYFFEAKALERQGNRAAAVDVYKNLIKRFDHTYYAYRAQEKINSYGISSVNYTPINGEEFSAVLDEIDEKNTRELAALMEIWEQANAESLRSESSKETQSHLEKYKELMNQGLTSYAADEARYLVDVTSDTEKDSLQIRLGTVLAQSGEYRIPIKFADRKAKAAVIAGKPGSISPKIWQLAYPKAYWKHVDEKADDFGIDPYLVLAVMREESRFNPRATSRSSARGLMQIMPATGKGIAKNLDLKRYKTRRLYEPELNIEMGVYYLSTLIKRFQDNFYLALAGYNGGPNRIKKYVNSWYDGKLGLVDIDEFVESIPRQETRLYVQKVMGSYFEYKRLYARKR